jgi:hypothetical protein
MPITPAMWRQAAAALSPGYKRHLHRLQAPHADPTIAKAHAFLVDVEPSSAPILSQIRLQHLDGPHGIGYTDGSIAIDPRCPAFKAAEAGDILPLCALLVVHEQAHLEQDGESEVVAYTKTLLFLERHRADRSLIQDVRARLTAARAAEEKASKDMLRPLQREVRKRTSKGDQHAESV